MSYADATAAPGTIVAIANADICFDDETCLDECRRALQARRNVVLALARHDEDAETGEARLFGGGCRPDAQDAWCYVSPLDLGRAKAGLDAIELGRGGADNRVAFDLLTHGVDVRNVGRSVVVRHLHKDDASRRWSVGEIKPPYAYLPPTTVEASAHPQFAPLACLNDGKSKGDVVLRVGDCACHGCGSLRALLREWHRLGFAKVRHLESAGFCHGRWRERTIGGEAVRRAPIGDVLLVPSAHHRHAPPLGPCLATLVLAGAARG